jgi:hypothetical protein
VLDVGQLLADTPQQTDLPKRAMKVARIVREVGARTAMVIIEMTWEALRMSQDRFR